MRGKLSEFLFAIFIVIWNLEILEHVHTVEEDALYSLEDSPKPDTDNDVYIA